MSARDGAGEPWLFGYGSLVWRPDFSFLEARSGWIEGWVRRFWQGSTDHRGIPGAPGRVVTLVAQPGAVCWGRAYRIAPRKQESVFAGLDLRERGGYAREPVRIQLAGEKPQAVQGTFYRATPRNPNYLGPRGLEEIADQVRGSRGPSGSNLEYVLELAQSLRRMGVASDPVLDLEELLLESGGADGAPAVRKRRP